MSYIIDFLTNIWNAIVDVFQGFFNLMSTFWINDLLDILILSYIIYKVIGWVRETRAAQLVKGIFVLLIAYTVSGWLQLNTIQWILEHIVNTGIVVIVVLFQPEFRSILERFGRTKVSKLGLFGISASVEEYQHIEKIIDDITIAAEQLSKTKTGALIVFEREIKLGEQIATGVQINADISPELIGNLFYHNSPLHDGAVIIRDSKILAASCFLPKPSKEEYIARELGSRHRAAIGISEVSDSVTLVVSEETGQISLAEAGRLTRDYNRRSLKLALRQKLLPKIDKKAKEEETENKGGTKNEA